MRVAHPERERGAPAVTVKLFGQGQDEMRRDKGLTGDSLMASIVCLPSPASMRSFDTARSQLWLIGGTSLDCPPPIHLTRDAALIFVASDESKRRSDSNNSKKVDAMRESSATRIEVDENIVNM